MCAFCFHFCVAPFHLFLIMCEHNSCAHIVFLCLSFELPTADFVLMCGSCYQACGVPGERTPWGWRCRLGLAVPEALHRRCGGGSARKADAEVPEVLLVPTGKLPARSLSSDRAQSGFAESCPIKPPAHA